MAEVGVLRSVLTASDNGFNASLNTGAANVDKFGGTANKNQGHFIKFNTHVLESRRAVSTLAAAMGGSTGQIMHFVHAFGTFGIAGGAAIGTLLAVNEIINAQTEALKKANESANKFHESWKDTDIHGIGKELTRLKQEAMELQYQSESWGGFLRKVIGIDDKEHLDQLNAAIKRKTENYKNLKETGQLTNKEDKKYEHATPHIQEAMRAQSAEVFRLEHSAATQSPMVQQQQITNDKLDVVANVVKEAFDKIEAGFHGHNSINLLAQ
jgi:hypothetical protein